MSSERVIVVCEGRSTQKVCQARQRLRRSQKKAFGVSASAAPKAIFST